MYKGLIAVVLSFGFVSGSIPLLLLFIDYRKQIHKPFIYIFVFFASWLLLLMFLLDHLGVWLALLAPLLVFVYVAAMRWAWKATGRS